MGRTDQIQTIYYFKPFKDENPKRTRNKILKRVLSAKTHFFENSIRQILFEKRTVLKTYELRFTEDEFLKNFLAPLRDFLTRIYFDTK